MLRLVATKSVHRCVVTHWQDGRLGAYRTWQALPDLGTAPASGETLTPDLLVCNTLLCGRVRCIPACSACHLVPLYVIRFTFEFEWVSRLQCTYCISSYLF